MTGALNDDRNRDGRARSAVYRRRMGQARRRRDDRRPQPGDRGGDRPHPRGDSGGRRPCGDSSASGIHGWAAKSPQERGALLAAVAEGLSERGDELAVTIATELGMPLPFSRLIQVGLPTMSFASMAGLLLEPQAEEEIGNSLVVREPYGVVAAIAPWNYPLHQIAAKVAPALASGCTVVLKPSEVTPLCAFTLAEICHDAGLPPGVLNIVTAAGRWSEKR